MKHSFVRLGWLVFITTGFAFVASLSAADPTAEKKPVVPAPAAKQPPPAAKSDKAKKKNKAADPAVEKPIDPKNIPLYSPTLSHDGEFEKFGIYEKTAPRPKQVVPIPTALPLQLQKGDRIALIGNTLFERSGEFGHFEALLQQQFPQHELVVRHLAWSADAIDVQPRPDNFADTEQHLTHEKADVIFAAYGFNESFAGETGLKEFRRKLTEYLAGLKSKTFNGKSAHRTCFTNRQ